MITFLFDRFPRRLLLPYRNGFWIWHMAAGVVTALIVFTGFDWWFFRHTRSEVFLPIVMIGGVSGMLVPVLLPIFLYIRGKQKKNKQLLRTAVAVAQAAATAWIIVAVYKVFTGRIQPDFLFQNDNASVSSGFQFGFFEHGIFWGWPSHHTVVAVAVATVLYRASPSSFVRMSAVAWAGIVAAGAAVGFHWFSDMVAGFIIGVAVGIALWKDVIASQRK